MARTTKDLPKNDRYGRMRHYARFGAGYITTFDNGAYYWAHCTADGTIGRKGWIGPFETRKSASAAEQRIAS